jgi:hypothetical protein
MRNRLDSLCATRSARTENVRHALRRRRQDAARVFTKRVARRVTDEEHVRRALADVERIALVLTNAMLGGSDRRRGTIVTNSNDPG